MDAIGNQPIQVGMTRTEADQLYRRITDESIEWWDGHDPLRDLSHALLQARRQDGDHDG